MMTVKANAIIAKPNDYKVCGKCSSINWYENQNCHACGHTKFTADKRAVFDEVDSYIDIEYDHNEEFYDTHPEIDAGDYTYIEI